MCMVKITNCGKTLIFLRLLSETLDLDLWMCVESYVLCAFVGRDMCRVLASVWRDVWCACAVVSFFCPVHSYISRTMETTSLGMLPCSSAEPEETSLQFPSPPHHTFLIALNNANYSLSPWVLL